MNKILFLMPYFNALPEWINLFIESCKYNPTINWLLITDCPEPENQCPNFQHIKLSWQECQQLISERLSLSFRAENRYKLCDLRPAFGIIFSEYVKGYDFIGFGDIDCIYGNIRHFLTPQIFENNLITTHTGRVNGHFCLMKNVAAVKEAFYSIKGWKETFEDPRNLLFDEDETFYGLKRVYAKESFNTSLSVFTPWLKGKFKFPKEWYWRQGRLWNNLNGRDREFLYLHFKYLNSHWQQHKLNPIVHFDYRNAPFGWKINLNGFFARDKIDDDIASSECIIVKPQHKTSILRTCLSRVLRAVRGICKKILKKG